MMESKSDAGASRGSTLLAAWWGLPPVDDAQRVDWRMRRFQLFGHDLQKLQERFAILLVTKAAQARIDACANDD
jgi:hypothetical protein